MFGIWFTGFIGIILARAFYAGMKSKQLFYRGPRYSFEDKNVVFDENKVFSFVVVTFCVAITWLFSLPLIGIYMLGQRFNKEA